MTVTRGGYQCLILPMKNFKISQGNNGQFSHMLVNALDICGVDTGAEYAVAPCDMHYVAHDTYANGNAVWFESDRPVLFADGTINYATIMMIHCNDISWVIGRSFKQGEVCYQEGTAGPATGNHIHFEIAKGRFTKCYAYNYTSGVYHLPGSISADQACITDGTTMYNWGQPVGGCGSSMSWRSADEIPGYNVNFSGYSDVPEDSYFYEAVKALRERGLFVVPDDHLFHPAQGMKRIDALVTLWRLKCEPSASHETHFCDVPSDHYGKPAADWTAEQGIVQGVDYHLRPDDILTRGEAAAYLYRICGQEEVEGSMPFDDVSTGMWFYEPILWCYKHGIMKGKSERQADPYGPCSRAEWAVMVDRTIDRKKQG